MRQIPFHTIPPARRTRPTWLVRIALPFLAPIIIAPAAGDVNADSRLILRRRARHGILRWGAGPRSPMPKIGCPVLLGGLAHASLCKKSGCPVLLARSLRERAGAFSGPSVAGPLLLISVKAATAKRPAVAFSRLTNRSRHAIIIVSVVSCMITADFPGSLTTRH